MLCENSLTYQTTTVGCIGLHLPLPSSAFFGAQNIRLQVPAILTRTKRFYTPILQSTATGRLHIKESKTDPFRLGVDLFLSRPHHSVCPVKALEKYMARSRSRASDLTLFSHADGSFLTSLRLTSMLRSLLHQLGFNEDQNTGHSFRIGAATTAAAAGLPDWLIKTLGRWSSDCYQRYI